MKKWSFVRRLIACRRPRWVQARPANAPLALAAPRLDLMSSDSHIFNRDWFGRQSLSTTVRSWEQSLSATARFIRHLQGRVETKRKYPVMANQAVPRHLSTVYSTAILNSRVIKRALKKGPGKQGLCTQVARSRLIRSGAYFRSKAARSIGLSYMP